jgi:hypothetical protein
MLCFMQMLASKIIKVIESSLGYVFLGISRLLAGPDFPLYPLQRMSPQFLMPQPLSPTRIPFLFKRDKFAHTATGIISAIYLHLIIPISLRALQIMNARRKASYPHSIHSAMVISWRLAHNS